MATPKNRLWDYFDGEPFLDNPHLAIINPNKEKRMSRKSVRRNVRKSSRRKARRNAFPVAGLVVNPRRRKATRKRRNVVYRGKIGKSAGTYKYTSNPRRHKSRRNPAILGVAMPPLAQVGWGAAGFLAPPMVESFINKVVPTELKNNVIGKYAVRIAAVVGLTYFTKTFVGMSEARSVALGGSMYVVTSAVSEFAPNLLPGTSSLGAYRLSNSLGAYTTKQLGAPNWGARNNAGSAINGGMDILPQRFRRFQ